jgi:DNA-binding NarL/FixJ family response regulator
MLRVVLTTARPQALKAFAAALSSNPEVQVQLAPNGAAALEATRSAAPQLVIIDRGLADAEPLELVQKLLMVNAMVNTAVISSVSEDEFHEASEGLGVLASLPEDPGTAEAADLLKKLQTVLGL